MLLNKERALALMQEENLDALVAVAHPNVYYLSDYDPAEPKDIPWTAAARSRLKKVCSSPPLEPNG
jgi:hypothetical protein